jgi:hypothetical protein
MCNWEDNCVFPVGIYPEASGGGGLYLFTPIA